MKIKLLTTCLAALLINSACHAQGRYPSLLIFASFSMPPASLKQWLSQAQDYHGSVVIRGLVHNSFKETAEILVPLLKEHPGGMMVDPTLFTRYGITQVPAVVIQQACPPEQSCPFAVVYGNTELRYALTELTKTPLGKEAQRLLEQVP